MPIDIEKLRNTHACVPVLAELARNQGGMLIHAVKRKLKLSDAEVIGSLAVLQNMGLVVREAQHPHVQAPEVYAFAMMGYFVWSVHHYKITDEGKKALHRLNT